MGSRILDSIIAWIWRIVDPGGQNKIPKVSDHANPSQTPTIASLILQSCGVDRFHSFQQEASIADLDASIRYFERAENLTTQGQLQPLSHYKYSVALLSRFRLKGDDADLDHATNRLEVLLKTPRLGPLQLLSIKTLAEALHLRSERTGSISSLDTVIQLERQVLDICSADDPERETCYTRLASALVQRSRMNDSIADINDAVGLYLKAVLIRPFGHPERSHPLVNLATALRYRYAVSRDQMDLDRAVFCERQAQDLCSSPQPYHSLASKSRIVESQRLTLTVQSLDRCSFAIETNNTNSIGQLKDMVLDKIGACVDVHGLFYEGHLLSDEWTIADCITNIKSVIYLVYTARSTLTSNDAIHVTNADTGVRLPVDPIPGAQCTSAGEIFSITDSDHTSGDDDVINLVTPNVARENADKSDDGELLRVQVMRLLEMEFSSKAKITLALVAASRDLGRAIEYLFRGIPEKQKALVELYIALKGGVDMIMIENDPGNSGTDGSLVGNPSAGPSASSHMIMNGEALDMVELCRMILENTPPDHPNRSNSLENLGIALRARFVRAGDRADLDAAIKYHEQALELRPPGHSDRSSSLNNLAVVIKARFDQAGDRADLDAAIKYHEQALELRPPGHSHRSSSLNNLAVVIQARFDQAGDRADLDAAIKYFEQALELRPPGHSDRSSSLNNLALVIKARFDQEGDRADLDAAIKYHEQALELLPPGHSDRSSSLGGLAAVIEARFDQAGDRADLDAAIKYHEQALELRPPGHSHRSCSLNNLAVVIKARFDQAGDRADLDVAIEYHKQALELRPPGHSHRSSSLNNLALVIKARFDQAGDRADLDAAIEYHEQALELRPPGHSHRSSSLNNLALVIKARFDQAGDRADLDRAMLLMEEACCRENGHLQLRFRLSLRWAHMSLKYAYPSVLDAFATALELLDTFVTMSRSLDSRHNRMVSDMLGHAKSLASDAAAVALDEEQPRRAVELLEQGRGILLAQLAQYRTALDDLQAVSPEMAAEFTDLSAQLEQSVSVGDVDGVNVKLELGVLRPDAVGSHQGLSMRWKDIVNRIRELSGFTTFLQPTPFHLLAHAASEGPVIIINVSAIRSDAIILQKGVEADVVKLPDATPAVVERMSSLMEAALGVPGSSECENGIKLVLGLLWESIVQFIVKRLEERGLPRNSRIWWCPTSALCLLPLHAAGIYQPDQPNLPDMFISSYTRTLSTLIRARTLEPHSATRPSILAIGVPRPDGDDGTDVPLEFVGEELDILMKRVPGTELLEDSAASHDAVVERLPTRPWVHIACHGHQDITRPFQSRFRLQDKPLTLREVIRMKLPDAEFAFLSACHTATGDRNTPDEGLHLAAAMQFAGYRSVVGTLWAMDDVDGPDVADSFYKFLFHKKKDGKAGDYKEAAKGVSRFTKMLRSRKDAREVPFERWVNFIHVGA